MLTIGLTGNFGMGKSTVLGLFRKLGVHTFNVDLFVSEILKRPAVIRKISKLLGNDVIRKNNSGASLNKKKVAEVVFADRSLREGLEGIVHPEVLKMMKRSISSIRRRDKDAYILFEIPLLFETGFNRHLDKSITVYSRREDALNRLKEKGISRDDALSRLKAQMPIGRKKKLADFVIDNSNGIEKTKRQVDKIYKSLLKHG